MEDQIFQQIVARLDAPGRSLTGRKMTDRRFRTFLVLLGLTLWVILTMLVVRLEWFGVALALAVTAVVTVSVRHRTRR